MSRINEINAIIDNGGYTVELARELLDVITNGIPFNILEAICSAERDGTLHIAPDNTSIPVWLPCKEGDTMYSSTLGKVRSFIVAGFEFYDKKLFVVEQIKIGREMREYGKAAHRTQAEAEAALAPEGGQGDARSTP